MSRGRAIYRRTNDLLPRRRREQIYALAAGIVYDETARLVTIAITITETDVLSRPISELTDDFPGSTLDSAKWNTSSTPATVSGGVGHLNPSTDNDYVSIISVNRYNVFGSSYHAEFVVLPVNSGPSNQSGIGLRLDANNTIEFGHWQTNLGFILAGTVPSDNDSGFIAYNATDHRWLRIRADATTLYFDTSPDGTAWTERFSHAMVSYGVGAVQASAFAGWFGVGDTDSGEATIDKVNIPGPQTYNETGRTVTIAGTVTATDIQAHKELDRLVSSTVTVTKTDVQHHQELTRSVTVAGTVTVPTQSQKHSELARLVSAVITVTAFDTFQGTANETDRLVSIAVTVTATDVQAMKEFDRAVTVAATVTAATTQAHKEFDRTVSVAVTVTAPVDKLSHKELARTVTTAVTVSCTDVQAHKELARATTTVVTVTATDTVFNSAQEFRTVTLTVTVTAIDVVRRVDTDRLVLAAVTVTATGVQHNAEVARLVLATIAVSATSLQRMAEATALTVLVSVLATDFYRPLESAAPWHQPAGTITSATPNGNVNSVGGGSTISDVIPDTTITDRRG